MATEQAAAGRDVFEPLNIDYEHAYRHNPYKKACVQKALTMLKSGSRVLDVGCGTGVPVSQMLSEAGCDVTGFDIAPKMVELARERVKGNFLVADLLEYEPEGTFAGIFIIYAQLSLNYAQLHAMVTKLTKNLEPNGIIAIGQTPADVHVKAGDPAWDESGAYVEDFNLPFWGKPFNTLMLSRAGQVEFLRSMGLEIVSDTLDVFQPDNPACDPEHQQYVIARRPDNQPLSAPQPLPNKRS